MPTGKANITAGSGQIATSSRPTPVSFNTQRFPTVKQDMIVYFERSSDPTVAKLVRPATAGDQLAMLAVPELGLTPKAHELLAKRIESLVANTRHAPGRDIDQVTRLKKPIAEMREVGTKLTGNDTRVGVSAVRMALSDDQVPPVVNQIKGRSRARKSSDPADEAPLPTRKTRQSSKHDK